MEKYIRIKGARAHNLKNIDVNIPRDKLVVITGLSGSGKSSLAFDTIYAEGQRRYVESLSSYARQFLGQMDKPDVDQIDGLSPAISIDQKTTSHNPRSTVGTVTEIYDYLRLLFARAGHPHCPKCGKPITQQSVDQMIDQIRELPERTKLLVMAQVVRGKKGEHKKVLAHIRHEGYVRVRIDGEVMDIGEDIQLEKNKKHTIEVVIDRLVVREGMESRLADSLETALKLGEGVAYVQIVDGELLMFSENFACVDCGISLPEITPRMFSFNNPYGACPVCMGLGSHMEFDEELVLPDPTLSVGGGVFAPLSKNLHSYAMCVMKAILENRGYSLETPWQEIDKKTQQVLLYGSGEERFTFRYTNMFGEDKEYFVPFEGVMPLLARRYHETDSDEMRESYENYMTEIPCKACHGARLKPETLAVTVGGKNIDEVTRMTIREADEFFTQLTLTPREMKIAAQILKEIHARLHFLLDVGLDYLTLSRSAGTLSGGEAQRVCVARAILKNAPILVLDEATAFADPENEYKMQQALQSLIKGKTVIIIAHRLSSIVSADNIVVLQQGRIVQQGQHDDLSVAEGLYKNMWDAYTSAYHWKLNKN
jgi:excinuclease ABC subunit A